jgi:hypothetical protein
METIQDLPLIIQDIEIPEQYECQCCKRQFQGKSHSRINYTTFDSKFELCAPCTSDIEDSIQFVELFSRKLIEKLVDTTLQLDNICELHNELQDIAERFEIIPAKKSGIEYFKFLKPE